MAATKRDRLDEFFRRLASQPPSRTPDDALERICRTLDEVEDELSGIPKATPPPPPGRSDGRMYPPLNDLVTRLSDGGLTARTTRHDISIGPDGSIIIRHRTSGAVEFQQAGGS